MRCCALLALLLAATPQAAAQEPWLGAAVAATSAAEADLWAARIVGLEAEGRLSRVAVQRDADFAGRQHVRYDQRIRGVRVHGHQLVRQLDESGRTLTVFGRLLEAPEIDTRPVVEAQATALAAAAGVGSEAFPVDDPELVVLSLDSGLALAWRVLVRNGGDLQECFVDAGSGAVLLQLEALRAEGTIGTGTGVWGDVKKVSVSREGAAYRALDELRPAGLSTYDLGFDAGVFQTLARTQRIDPAYLAKDADNDWTDGAVVDTHAYLGWTYDYYFKRYGRHGIDAADRPVKAFVHVARRLANAFWDPALKSLFLGDGDGPYAPFGGALDVVAHELSHGVTGFTWNGSFGREALALNEAFSDIMGTSTEFFQEPVGNGRHLADYWLGEDLSFRFDPPQFAVRSMADPGSVCHAFGDIGCDPDHYRNLYQGVEDAGGVHVNAGIPNHAFFLLIEGGTNRTSGIHVDGLGATNRERAEKIFYRGFTAFLTPAATFADARRATLRAAEELYGVASREVAETALAWHAVGVD